MADLRSLLQEVYDERNRLTPADVVDAARPPDSPLHDRFEWDDSVAAEHYRKTQAAQLIRSVRITYTSTTGDALTLRAFHSTPTASGGRSYEPLDKITENPMTMRILLREMERDFAQMRRRYSHMSEFWAMLEQEINGKTG